MLLSPTTETDLLSCLNSPLSSKANPSLIPAAPATPAGTRKGNGPRVAVNMTTPASAPSSALGPKSGGSAESIGSPNADLELELTLRGHVIIDQQRRIVELEGELDAAQRETARLREEIDRLKAGPNSHHHHHHLHHHLIQSAGSVAHVLPPSTFAAPLGPGTVDPDDKKAGQTRYWTPAEHQRFLEGLAKYGPKDVKAISEYVATRTATQVRTHSQKYFLRLAKMQGQAGLGVGVHGDPYGQLGLGDDMDDSDGAMDMMMSLKPGPGTMTEEEAARKRTIDRMIRKEIDNKKRKLSKSPETAMKMENLPPVTSPHSSSPETVQLTVKSKRGRKSKQEKLMMQMQAAGADAATAAAAIAAGFTGTDADQLYKPTPQENVLFEQGFSAFSHHASSEEDLLENIRRVFLHNLDMSKLRLMLELYKLKHPGARIGSGAPASGAPVAFLDVSGEMSPGPKSLSPLNSPGSPLSPSIFSTFAGDMIGGFTDDKGSAKTAEPQTGNGKAADSAVKSENTGSVRRGRSKALSMDDPPSSARALSSNFESAAPSTAASNASSKNNSNAATPAVNTPRRRMRSDGK